MVLGAAGPPVLRDWQYGRTGGPERSPTAFGRSRERLLWQTRKAGHVRPVARGPPPAPVVAPFDP